MTLDKLLEKETNRQRRQRLTDLFAELEAAGPKRPAEGSEFYYRRAYLARPCLCRYPHRRHKGKVIQMRREA